MGRYYTGDIEGKFWCGTQDSDDATFFHIMCEHQCTYYYPCCGETADRNSEETCPNCSEPEEQEESQSQIYYYFYKNDEQVEKMKERIAECFDALEIAEEKRSEYMHKDDEEKKAYYDRLEDILAAPYLNGDEDKAKWAARLMLGLRINHVLSLKDECELYCDC